MSKHMLICNLIVPNATARATGKTQIGNYLATIGDKWTASAAPLVSDLIDATNASFPVIGVSVRVWVVSLASKDAIEAKVREFVANNNQYIGAGSQIKHHICTHDSASPQPCVETVLWSK